MSVVLCFVILLMSFYVFQFCDVSERADVIEDSVFIMLACNVSDMQMYVAGGNTAHV